ncbi:MAG: PTS fructose transporter subunit IIABC [Metamycoplasmataceae bacterium]
MLNIKNIFLNLDLAKRDDVFEFISTQAISLNIIAKKDKQNLVDAFIKRENESTTGFEDGFAIPHARISAIKKPAIIVVRSNSDIEWNAMDGKATRIAIALLIPEDQSSTLHIDTLSKIATLLLDPKFRKNMHNFKTEEQIFNYLNERIKENKEVVKQSKAKTTGNIVGVSACATGVAHTYMAKQALEDAGMKKGYKVRIETQGQKGIEDKLTDEEISKADAIIIASDIYIDLERFHGKKLLKLKTNDAISQPEKCIDESLKSPIFGDSSEPTKPSKSENSFSQSKSKIFMGHLLSGVSRMIPFIVFSGIVWAIMNSLGAIDSIKNDQVYLILLEISQIGFVVFIAMMGGFIAESITGRAGFAPGFISTFAAANSSFTFWWNIPGVKNPIPQIDFFFSDAAELGISNVGLSLFGAIIMGFAAGYLVKWILTWKTPKLITPIISIIFIPVVSTVVLSFPFILLLSGPLGFIMNSIVFGLSEAAKINGVNFLIGFLLGCMIGFDMGGPINKIAGTCATALIVVDPRLMGAVAAAIPIAPLGCGLATIWARKKFTEKERAEGISALGLGFFGISEGAIPFAVNRPKQVLIANVIASGIAGGLSFLFFVGGYVGMWGGPITAIVGGVSAPITELGTLGQNIPNIFGGSGNGMQYISIFWFFLTIIAGAIIHSLIFVLGINLSTAEGKSHVDAKWNNFRKKISTTLNKQKTNIHSLKY